MLGRDGKTFTLESRSMRMGLFIDTKSYLTERNDRFG